MFKIVTVELRKSLKNKWFYLALGLGCGIALLSVFFNAVTDFSNNVKSLSLNKETYIALAPSSLYHYWIVTDFIQPATDLFFLLVPLLAVLPYAWSLASELKSGAIRNALTRTTRINHYGAKFVAAFVAGALAVGVPVVLNFVVCACFMPAYIPDIGSILYLGIAQGSLWSQLFYSNPLLYSALMTLINFLFGGLWAMVVMALAFFIKNRIALLFGPFLVLLFIKFFESRVFSINSHYGLTPFSYLRGTGTQFFSNGWVVFGEYVAFFVFVCCMVAIFKRKDIL